LFLKGGIGGISGTFPDREKLTGRKCDTGKKLLDVSYKLMDREREQYFMGRVIVRGRSL